jgi:hypothetical protein
VVVRGDVNGVSTEVPVEEDVRALLQVVTELESSAGPQYRSRTSPHVLA